MQVSGTKRGPKSPKFPPKIGLLRWIFDIHLPDTLRPSRCGDDSEEDLFDPRTQTPSIEQSQAFRITDRRYFHPFSILRVSPLQIQEGKLEQK